MRYFTGESDQPAVLVLRALGLGDLATAVPALRGIRRHFPDHRIVLATSPWLAPLVQEMSFVDGMLPAEGLSGLPVQMEGDDLAVNLHGRGPESTLLLLDSLPDRLVAFAHPDVPATYGFPRWHRGEHEVRRWCRLLHSSGIEASPDDLDLPPPRRDVADLAGATVIHPGASAPARHWPPDRWAVVARQLASRGERVIVTGSAAEVALASEVAREADLDPSSVVAGRTDAAGLAAIVAAARRLLSSDTGPAHLATAYGTPSVTLFGPTSPDEWGPPPRAHHITLWKGRRGDPDGPAAHPGLLSIRIEEVLEAVDRLPESPGSHSDANRAATSRSATI